MSLLLEATQAMTKLHQLTSALKTGSSPDPYSILGIQSDLVRLHWLLGEEMSRKFGAKERMYLARKIEQAKQYQKGRVDLKLTIGDSTEAALLAVGEEYGREIESAEEYERYRIFLKSIQAAIDHSRQVVSFLKSAESSPSS